jgi:hypothetical protein
VACAAALLRGGAGARGAAGLLGQGARDPARRAGRPHAAPAGASLPVRATPGGPPRRRGDRERPGAAADGARAQQEEQQGGGRPPSQASHTPGAAPLCLCAWLALPVLGLLRSALWGGAPQDWDGSPLLPGYPLWWRHVSRWPSLLDKSLVWAVRLCMGCRPGSILARLFPV